MINAVQGAAQAGNPGVKLAPVLADEGFDSGAVAVLGGGDDRAHLVQRQVVRAQQADQPGLGDLVAAVQPVPVRGVDVRPLRPATCPTGSSGAVSMRITLEPSPGAASSATGYRVSPSRR